jgi:hypothetical protein
MIIAYPNISLMIGTADKSAKLSAVGKDSTGHRTDYEVYEKYGIATLRLF